MIEIIPPGSSAVVTEHNKDRNCSASERVMEALVDMANAEGLRYGNTVAVVKDAAASLERATGMHYADTVKTVKDAEAGLERSMSNGFINSIQDVKDAESRLHKDAGDKFIQIIQDVKDAETRLDRAAGDRFIETIQDVKEVGLGVEKSKGKAVETLKDFEYENEKSHGKTRERVEWSERELEKTAYQNQIQTLLQFKDQALLTEKLALKQELHADRLAAEAAAKAAECCCELREAIKSDGDKTRALINAQEVDRLRDKAAQAEAKLAAYFTRGVAPVCP